MSEKPTPEALAAARAVVAEWLLHGDWTGPEQCVPALARGFDAFAAAAVRESVARMHQFMYDWMRQDGDTLACSRADFEAALAHTLSQFKKGTA